MVKEGSATYRITDLAVDDRPRERLAQKGSQALSTAELLAILLRVGTPGENAVELGQRLLQTFGGLRGMHKASFLEISQEKGVGLAKAAQIEAALELGNRLRLEEPDERPAIHSPADVADLVAYEMEGLPQEQLWVLVLDTRNRVLSIEKLYSGSVNASFVRIAELFRPAIQRNAAAVLLVHNHPSGDPSPSAEDVALTRAAGEAGRLLDIEVLDHLVIGQGRHFSLKEHGLGGFSDGGSKAVG